MSGKFNNKGLLIILAVLVVIFLVTRTITSKNREHSLNTELVGIDTARVDSISLYPASGNGGKILFEREGQEWIVKNETITTHADNDAVHNLLGTLLNIKTERLVARARDKWPDYHVNDSLGTRVVIREGNKTTLDMIVGRIEYQQPAGGYGAYGNSPSGGNTYVRLANQDEVYSVEGFLAMNINQDFNSWRNHRITHFHVSELSKITFDYPADSGFIALKTNAGWTIGGIRADSASMSLYLNSNASRYSYDFEDGFDTSSPADYQVTFEGDNMNPLNIKAYIQSGGDLVLHSSINQDAWFRSEPPGLFRDIFKSSSDLVAPGGLTRN